MYFAVQMRRMTGSLFGSMKQKVPEGVLTP